MSFFEFVKENYRLSMNASEEDTKVFVEKNLFQEDYIQKNNEMVNIYRDNVSIDDIILFFKEKMPYVNLVITNPPSDLNERDKLITKFVVFSKLVGLMEDSNKKFTASFTRPSLADQFISTKPSLH